ncbi:hypothetical protein GCM10012285_22330 [Streptomyces kronopolitis]|uniref:Uncharacterized protein n=1 Tax=Streptomyces kronopolitis TaxID=1612435 RepID=A0ABQ2J9W6_9ACTN|nr:hypothetical protein GCM10012285_22330 [Streptomyces kronopolitis]
MTSRSGRFREEAALLASRGGGRKGVARGPAASGFRYLPGCPALPRPARVPDRLAPFRFPLFLPTREICQVHAGATLDGPSARIARAHHGG